MGNRNQETMYMEVVCKTCGKKVRIEPHSVYRDYDSFFHKYFWNCPHCKDNDNRVLIKDMEPEFKRIVKLLNQNRSF